MLSILNWPVSNNADAGQFKIWEKLMPYCPFSYTLYKSILTMRSRANRRLAACISIQTFDSADKRNQMFVSKLWAAEQQTCISIGFRIISSGNDDEHNELT